MSNVPGPQARPRDTRNGIRLIVPASYTVSRWPRTRICPSRAIPARTPFRPHVVAAFALAQQFDRRAPSFATPTRPCGRSGPRRPYRNWAIRRAQSGRAGASSRARAAAASRASNALWMGPSLRRHANNALGAGNCICRAACFAYNSRAAPAVFL